MKLNQFKNYALVALLAGTLFPSCVATKKYEALEALNASGMAAQQECLEQKAGLQTSYNQLQAEKDQLASRSSAALDQKQKELTAKENELILREQTVTQLRKKLSDQTAKVQDLKNKVSESLVGYKADELSVYVKNGQVYVSLADKLLFPSGSDKVNAQGAEALKTLATVLKKNEADLTIYIEGHTDSIPIVTGKFKDNWDLSVYRSTSIIRILTSNGVSPQQIIASGKGEFSPVASNSTPEGRQLNRRTEIILSPDLDELWEILSSK